MEHTTEVFKSFCVSQVAPPAAEHLISTTFDPWLASRIRPRRNPRLQLVRQPVKSDKCGPSEETRLWHFKGTVLAGERGNVVCFRQGVTPSHSIKQQYLGADTRS